MHLGIYPKKREKGDTFKYWFLSTELNAKGISIARTFKKQRKAIFIHTMVPLSYLLYYKLSLRTYQSKPLYMPFLLTLSNYAIFFTYKTLHNTCFLKDNITVFWLTLSLNTKATNSLYKSLSRFIFLF